MVGKVTPDNMASASRLPAIMGFSKYRGQNDELLASIAAIKGEEREDISNEAMDWGNLIEPVILERSLLRLGLTSLDMDHTEPYFHKSLPLACSLDGTAQGDGRVVTTDSDRGIYVIGADEIKLDGVGVLEAKLTSVKPEDAPALYRGPLQLQAQMDIIGAKWGAICVLYQGTELRLFLFEPHAQTLEVIKRVVIEFQEKLDKFKSTGEIDYYPPKVGEKWFDDRGPFPVTEEEVDLGDGIEWMAQEIFTKKAEIKKLEKDVADKESDLQKLMDNATRARAGRFQISWPVKSYAAKPEKVVPATKAYTVRQSTLAIKERKT